MLAHVELGDRVAGRAPSFRPFLGDAIALAVLVRPSPPTDSKFGAR